MGNDVYGGETSAAGEGSRHLLGSWPGRIEQDRLDPRPQRREDGVDVGS
jgi:hypothetical protein